MATNCAADRCNRLVGLGQHHLGLLQKNHSGAREFNLLGVPIEEARLQFVL